MNQRQHTYIVLDLFQHVDHRQAIDKLKTRLLRNARSPLCNLSLIFVRNKTEKHDGMMPIGRRSGKHPRSYSLRRWTKVTGPFVEACCADKPKLPLVCCTQGTWTVMERCGPIPYFTYALFSILHTPLTFEWIYCRICKICRYRYSTVKLITLQAQKCIVTFFLTAWRSRQLLF
jgi:hypothetical protein